LKWAQLLTLLGPIPGGNVWKNIIVGIERSYYLVDISGLFLLQPAGSRRQSGCCTEMQPTNMRALFPMLRARAHKNNNNNLKRISNNNKNEGNNE
jgi:hypothetical protein